MASTITLKVKVNKDALVTLENDLTRIRNLANSINIDVRAMRTATVEWARYGRELQRVTQQLQRTTQQEVRYQTELERTRRSQNALEASANRRAATEASANARIVSAEQRTQQAVQRTNQELIRSTRAVTDNAGAWQRLFSAFSASTIITNGVTRAISAMRQYFHEALDEMKALDTAATHYMQVMGSETTKEETAKISQQAYSVGSKYGTSASDYMESIATYARAGYKDVADQLAELSMKTVIVGQTSQDVADQFLLTMDAAYKYGGSVKELSKVLDGASAIDSGYATTIEKIAAGLGLVAPLAEQVHVSEKELTAAIGTITAATQRSGAESARALRSLFLNIIGDTTTEIEDGVTATEESIASIQYLLDKYAHSAVEAAKATGQVVDPMKAIGALAQSMKDGLLSEAQLMELLSGIGGKLRISQLVALVSNWDMYTDMIKTYEGAMGSADAKVETYLDSWEAKTNILKNTWTEFVAKTINSDFAKGFLDLGTKLLKMLGDLKHGVILLGGAIATLRLINLARQMTQMSEASSQAALALVRTSQGMSAETFQTNLNTASILSNNAARAASTALMMNWVAIAVAAVTTAITAYNAYHQKRMQQLEEERDKAIDVAETEQEEANKISELYDVYYSAKKQYEDGALSIGAYETAVRNLAEALGLEADQIDKVIGKLEEKSQQEMQEAIKATEDALQLAKITANEELNKAGLNKYGGYTGIIESLPYRQHFSLMAELERATTADEAIPIYKELLEIQAKYLENSKQEGQIGKLYGQSYRQLAKDLEDYAKVLDPVIELQGELSGLQTDTFEMLIGETDPKTVEEVAEALGLTVEEATAAEESFEDLASAVRTAEDALAEYKESTKKELDTDFKSYADAWWAAWEDIQAGRTNSNKVNAAADLLLTDAQKAELYRQGISVADELKKPFWQNVFSYVDEEGVRQSTKGEDAGSLLGWYMYENFTDEAKNIIDENGKVIASFEEVDGALNINVKDYEELSNVLEELWDVDLDPAFLQVAFEAMGIFANEAYLSAGTAKELAKQLGALDEAGRINIDMIVSAALSEGWTKKQVDDLLESLGLLEEKGEVNLVFNPEGIDSASQKAEQLAEKKYEANIEDNADEVEEDFKNLEIHIQGVTNNGEPYDITFQTNADSMVSEMQRIQTAAEQAGMVIKQMNMYRPTKSANGQRNFRGGLSLVNEEAPELIVEGGYARIAGNGSPTLTYLAQGADVYTAQETKAILGGSYPAELYDGINAYAGGNVTNVQRWTPPSKESKNKSGGSSSSASSSSGSSSSSSDKDPELEALKSRIELLKSELNLMKERGDSLNKQIAKQREIQKAYKAEADYLRSIGGDQKEINDLETQWWKIENDINDALEKREKEKEEKAKAKEEKEKKKQEHTIDWYEKRVDYAQAELSLLEAQDAPVKKQISKQIDISNWLRKEINYLKKIGGHQKEILELQKQREEIEKNISDLQEGLMDDLQEAVKNEIEKLNKQRDEENEKIQAKIDALQEEKEYTEKVNEEEEKRLEILEAQEKLYNAQRQRTVRVYNAKTGQWEWVANANDVASAQESLNSAQKAMSDYNREKAFEKAIKDLEHEQEENTQIYKEQTDKWQKVLDAFEEPVITISEALKNIEKNLPHETETIDMLNALLEPLGYSINGGSKKAQKRYNKGKAASTSEQLSTALMDMLLKPITRSETLEQNWSVLSGLLRDNGISLAGTSLGSNWNQHNGDIYTFGSITLTDAQARQTTLYDFVQASKGLRAYNGTM